MKCGEMRTRIPERPGAASLSSADYRQRSLQLIISQASISVGSRDKVYLHQLIC